MSVIQSVIQSRNFLQSQLLTLYFRLWTVSVSFAAVITKTLGTEDRSTTPSVRSRKLQSDRVSSARQWWQDQRRVCLRRADAADRDRVLSILPAAAARCPFSARQPTCWWHRTSAGDHPRTCNIAPLLPSALTAFATNHAARMFSVAWNNYVQEKHDIARAGISFRIWIQLLNELCCTAC